MPFNLRSTIVGLLIACYGTAAFLGQGLHHFDACGHHGRHGGAVHEHEHSAREHRAGVHQGIDAGTPIADTDLIAADCRKAAPESACPICQYNAQGQNLSGPIDALCVVMAVDAPPHAASLFWAERVHHPYSPRGPPLSLQPVRA
jgi:hypothetical protein